MYIILVRHGETDLNRKGITQGQEVDPSINYLGQKQANLTGKYLNKYFKIEKIYSSPLKRAKQTAQIISSKLNFEEKIIYSNLLKEQRKGIVSGLPKDKVDKLFKKNKILSKIKKIQKKDKMKYLLSIEKYDKIYSKILKNESRNQLLIRAKNFFNQIKDDNQNILIVSHGSFIAAFISLLTKIVREALPSNIVKNSSPNCHITVIKYENGKYQLIKVRDNYHLKSIY